MLGPVKPRRLDETIAVSLEDLVPWDHFYRHLEAKFDISFVRDLAKECYADCGRPSIDPVVFFTPNASGHLSSPMSQRRRRLHTAATVSEHVQRNNVRISIFDRFEFR